MKKISLILTVDEGGEDGEVLMAAEDVELLAKANPRFRACVIGGFQEAVGGKVVWAVQSNAERAILLKLVADTLAAPYLYTRKRPPPVHPADLPYLTRIFLVANGFCFEALAKEYKYQICDAVDDEEDALAVLEEIPGEQHNDLEVADLMGIVCSRTLLRPSALQRCFCVDPTRVYNSLVGVRMVEAMTIEDKILALPPVVLPAGIKKSTRKTNYSTKVSGNILYMLMRCYVEQSPHCQNMDQGERTQLFGRMAEGLADSKSRMTPEFMSLVVGTCPYALQANVIPRLVVSNLVPDAKFLNWNGRRFPSSTFEATIRLVDLISLKPNHSKFYPCGNYEGFPIFIHVQRSHEQFYPQLVALSPGSSKDHGLQSSRICLRTRDFRVNYVNLCDFKVEAPMSFEEDIQDHMCHRDENDTLYKIIIDGLLEFGGDFSASWDTIVYEGSNCFPDGVMIIYFTTY